MFECKKYLEKSSMFPEDLFTVVVQRRPVARRSLLPPVAAGHTGGDIQFGIRLDGIHFFLTQKNIKFSFVN